MPRRTPDRPTRALLRVDQLEDRDLPSFTTPVIFTTGLNNPGSVAVGDLTGDGKPDLAATNYGSTGAGQTVSVFNNNGSGGFSGTPNFTLNTGTNGATYVTIADLNGDSMQDVVALSAPSSGNSQVRVFINNGASGFTPLAAVDSGGSAGAWLAVGDLDGDGDQDVAVANGGVFNGSSATGNNIVVLANNGAGALASAATLSVPATGLFGVALPRGVAVVDVDGDGKKDVVAVAAQTSFGSEANSTAATFHNSTSGATMSFGSGVSSDTGGLGVFGVVTADFDADGTPDLAIAHGGTTQIGTAGDGDVSILLNSGVADGRFQTPNVVFGNRRIFAVAVADFDGQNGVDFAAVEFPNRSSNGPLHVYLNGGNGRTFTRDTQTTTDTGIIGPQFINTGDFNADGKPDLVVVGENNQGVTYLNVAAAPPAAPTGLTATPGNAQVVLNWNSVTGATSYKIYRGTTSGGETLIQSGVTATTFTDTGLTNGTTYFYQVTAVNGGGESPRSSEVSATPQAPPAAPTAPTGVTATPGNAQVVLNWNAVSGAASYNIYRSTSSGAETLLQSGVTATSFTNTLLTNGTTYFYQVTAVNIGGESPRSSEVSATPQAPPAAPTAPTGVTATPGNTQVVLNWNAVSGASSYNIYRGTTSGGETLIQSGVTATTFTDTGLTNGTTYFYQVTAVNGGGESPRSSEVSATPQAPPAAPTAPTGVTATPGNAQVVLNWNAVSGAASYNIYRSTSSGAETLLQSGVTATSFTNTLLTNGTTYFYQVTAVNIGGESPKSAEVSATPQPPAPTAPPASAAPPAAAPKPAPPYFTGAFVFANLLVLQGNGVPGGIAVVPVPPGTLAFFSDVSGDGKGDVVLFISGSIFVLDGQSGNALFLIADTNGDGILEVIRF